jgi:hypothetical protein
VNLVHIRLPQPALEGGGRHGKELDFLEGVREARPARNRVIRE